MKQYLPDGITREKRTKQLNEDMRASIPAICLERARLVTESYQSSEGQPYLLRRARALAHILDHMTIFIRPEELIVGNHASRQRSAPLYPDTGLFSDRELDLLPVREVDTLQITEDQKRELREEIYPYWKGRCLEDLADNHFPFGLKQLMSHENNIFNALSRLRSGYGHYLPNIARILREGFLGSQQSAEEYLSKLSPKDEAFASKQAFYQACLIICPAVQRFAGRYAALAEEMAAQESCPRRKRELLLIARACKQVPYRPARNFHEALQSYWFTLLIDYIFQNGSAISCGRFDQFLYPYYLRDIQEGVLSKDEAQEMIEALFVKHNDVIKACTYASARNNGGFSTSAHLIVGGVDREGKDACNELTFLCLEADRNVFNCEPNIGVRYSEKNPLQLPEKIFEILGSVGGGKYPIFNDEVIIDALKKDGVPLEEARDYSIVGCVEPSPYGNSLGISNACYFNLAKCLELALSNGVCLLTGDQLGPQTGDARLFHRFSQVKHAFETQVDFFVQKMTQAMNLIEQCIAQYTPHIYCSILLDGCMQRGLDSAAGGSLYNYCGVQGVGVPDVGDALTAIQELVFRQKKFSMAKLVEMLESDFQGYECERQLLIHSAPKYGNDDDTADGMARYVGEYYCRQVARHAEWRGGKFRPGLYCVSANTPIGRQTGALASGRFARSPLADGGISPKHGMDLKGPTAVFRSASKLNLQLVTNGVDLNMKLLPSLARTRQDREKLAQLIRGYFACGGMHVQFNILSDEMLLRAQEHPEEFRSLVVRVAGYSAFFIDLDKDIQDEIIRRTAMSAF